MRERVRQEHRLPAHSITVDELASICDALSERFEVDPEEISTTIVLATTGRGIGFESTEDLLEHKSEIPDTLKRYGVEIEAAHPEYGRRKVEIHPPAISNPIVLLASITVYGGNVGWCADIVATALDEYDRYRLRFGWIYHPYVFLPVLTVFTLVAGRLFENIEEWTMRSLALFLPFVLCGALFIFLSYIASNRAKSAQIRTSEKRFSNMPQYIAVLAVVLQFITAILSVFHQLSST